MSVTETSDELHLNTTDLRALRRRYLATFGKSPGMMSAARMRQKIEAARADGERRTAAKETAPPPGGGLPEGGLPGRPATPARAKPIKVRRVVALRTSVGAFDLDFDSADGGRQFCAQAAERVPRNQDVIARLANDRSVIFLPRVGWMERSATEPLRFLLKTIAGPLDLVVADERTAYTFATHCQSRLNRGQHVVVRDAQGATITLLPGVGYMVEPA